MKRFHHGFEWIARAALIGMLSAGASAQDISKEGKKLFTQTAAPACALCHTLGHAGASGEVGPNLDELRPDASRVEKAVRNGIGQMPAFSNLDDAQVKLLADYVAAVAGSGR